MTHRQDPLKRTVQEIGEKARRVCFKHVDGRSVGRPPLRSSIKEKMMNALILYDSQYGNTERIAQAIAETLRAFGQVQLVRVDPAHPVEFQGMDTLIVGCPTQGWKPTPAIQSFLEGTSSERLRSLAVACFDTRFRMPRWMTGSAAGVMARKLQEMTVSLLLPPESFFVKGMQGPLRGGELDRAVTWARMLVKEAESFPPAAQRQA